MNEKEAREFSRGLFDMVNDINRAYLAGLHSPLLAVENHVIHDTQSAAKPFSDDVPDPVSDDLVEEAKTCQNS